jgi:hypothetical protein
MHKAIGILSIIYVLSFSTGAIVGASRMHIFGIDSTSGRVNVGVWEKYDKYSLPSQNVFINADEFKNDKDDDKDGYVDNINGIGFDNQERLIPEYFYCNTQTVENYNHGTAIANIIIAHCPQVLLHGVGFVPTTQRMKESGIAAMTVKERQAHIENEYASMKVFIDTSLAYFSKKECKVVNISWGLNLQTFIDNNPNLGTTPKERKQKAKEWLTTFKAYMENGFNQYPNILFVVAVGNDGQDIHQAMDVPGCIVLKNVIKVGALAADKIHRADYSNYGKDVLYAEGTDIRYTKALKQSDMNSGTSLAAPVITALIAELWKSDKHRAATITLDELKNALDNYKK